jgi:hypothetical protein
MTTYDTAFGGLGPEVHQIYDTPFGTPHPGLSHEVHQMYDVGVGDVGVDGSYPGLCHEVHQTGNHLDVGAPSLGIHREAMELWDEMITYDAAFGGPHPGHEVHQVGNGLDVEAPSLGIHREATELLDSKPELPVSCR